MNKFFGILNASPEKRYKNFISTITDLSEVWLFSNNSGYLTVDEQSYINLLVWPTKEFALYYNKNNKDTPVCIEIHEFCKRCTEICSKKNIRFMIFPTDKNTYIINTPDLVNDIQEELSRIE